MEIVVVEEQPVRGAERRVAPGMTVGRVGADIVLRDPEVSRRHAIFHEVGGGLGVEDLGSSNGTFVNGGRIDSVTVLSEGDALRFGQTVWRVGAAAVTGADPLPSGIARVVPTTVVYGELPTFEAVRPPSPLLGFSAARVVGATVFCYLVILATAASVTFFFVTR
jgi:hypothetical protein